MKKVKRDMVLERFMKEFFPYREFKQAGIFTKEMRGDYEAQAERIRKFLGYETIYEYRSETVSCHITYCGDRPLVVNTDGELQPEPFITVIPSIYE